MMKRQRLGEDDMTLVPMTEAANVSQRFEDKSDSIQILIRSQDADATSPGPWQSNFTLPKVMRNVRTFRVDFFSFLNTLMNVVAPNNQVSISWQTAAGALQIHTITFPPGIYTATPGTVTLAQAVASPTLNTGDISWVMARMLNALGFPEIVSVTLNPVNGFWNIDFNPNAPYAPYTDNPHSSSGFVQATWSGWSGLAQFPTKMNFAPFPPNAGQFQAPLNLASTPSISIHSRTLRPLGFPSTDQKDILAQSSAFCLVPITSGPFDRQVYSDLNAPLLAFEGPTSFQNIDISIRDTTTGLPLTSLVENWQLALNVDTGTQAF
jgi:hypothetical protein